MQLQTPPTPAVLEYGRPVPGRYASLLKPFRVLAFLGLLCWGYFMAVSLRGYGPGSCPACLLLATAIYVAPFACIAFCGVPWRRYFAIIALLVAVPALAADAQCTLEEKMFVASVRNLPPTAPTAFTSRWWPIRDCYLYYEPSTGQLGGGD